MKKRLAILLILGFSATLWVATHAQANNNWPNWRGPSFNGVADAGTYPTEWTQDKNVKWKIELPAFGSSTPAVWGDKIFVTSPRGEENVIFCFDLKGDKQWEAKIGNQRAGKHKMGSGSNPSPVTDGKHLWVYFKSGDFGCLDFDGKVVWSTNLQSEFGDDTLWWDLGTSPVLTEKHVVIACMQDGPSYLAAFGKADGELAWKHDRTFEVPKENDQSYTTPIVTMRDGKEEIIVLGADLVTGHSAVDGKQTWKVGGLNPKNAGYWRSISSPVLDNGILYAPYARGKTITAIKIGGTGDQTKESTLWVKDGISIDVPTPTVKDGKLYICNDKGAIECIDQKSGDTVWKTELKKSRGKFYASPIIAGDHIYSTREDGVTFVVNLKTKKVVSENDLGAKTAASPVFVNGMALIRTAEALYCIGQ